MLSHRQHYLQVALNSTLEEARRVISHLPVNERILVEAGTPLLKRYGINGLQSIKQWWSARWFFSAGEPYVVADFKAMDRGATEVAIAAQGGANAVTVLGSAPVETLDALIATCEAHNLDAIVDMMNVDKPYQVLRKLKKLPKVVMLHRGVDETEAGSKSLPIHLINKVKGAFDVLVAVGGGDTPREVQSAVFNGADIVMVWKDFYESGAQTKELAEEFLKEIK